MTISAAARRTLNFVVVLLGTFGCTTVFVDGATSLDFSGNRYYGAVIPLSIEPSDLTRVGVAERANGLAENQRELFRLRGVDPGDVLITAAAPDDRESYVVFVRDGVYPAQSPRPDLFQLVPELCMYANRRTPSCA